MTEDKQNFSLDLLGIKPISDAANTTIERSLEGIGIFLKTVCLPALNEVGLLARDKIRHWRLNNIIRILEKAKGKLHLDGEELKIQAHPRVALAIIENGSLSDSEELQEMWAGLFASSCTRDGQEDENLIFVNLLKQLTLAEARILKYSSENVQKIIHKNGLITGDDLTLDCKNLMDISGINEVHRLDRELDHLRSLYLIGSGLSGGFSAGDEILIGDISPTALALNLYVKSQGYNADPALYWGKENMITEEENKRLKAERQKIQADARKKDMVAEQ